MQALIENLRSLAKRDLAHLRRACGVGDDDISDMIGEIKRLDPKPGRRFGASVEPIAIPDVFVTAAPDGAWRVELNSEALPRVLVNETYATPIIRRGAAREADKQYVSAQLQSAHWLTKSLEQRARTILNVAAEIVRRQDGFLVEGVAALKPLNLKAVARCDRRPRIDSFARHLEQIHPDAARPVRDEVFLHHLYRFGRRGRSAFGRSRSATSIKQLIDEEDPDEVLSDDIIVERLREAAISWSHGEP